jgi:hypothetical protein
MAFHMIIVVPPTGDCGQHQMSCLIGVEACGAALSWRHSASLEPECDKPAERAGLIIQEMRRNDAWMKWGGGILHKAV